MNKRTVYLIWAGGAALALLIYLLGTDRVLTTLAYGWDNAMWSLHNWLRNVSGPVYDLIRACAIAVFVVFWVLGVMVVQRGQPGRIALLVFTLIFFWLVGFPSHWGNSISAGDWLTALLAVAIGALIMSQRLARTAR